MYRKFIGSYKREVDGKDHLWKVNQSGCGGRGKGANNKTVKRMKDCSKKSTIRSAVKAEQDRSYAIKERTPNGKEKKQASDCKNENQVFEQHKNMRSLNHREGRKPYIGADKRDTIQMKTRRGKKNDRTSGERKQRVPGRKERTI